MSSSTPLQERIARALAAYEGFDAEHLDHEFVVGEWYATAEALMPLVAAEVRRGQADAWDRAVRSLSYPDGSPVEVLSNPNPYRAQENHPEVTQ